MTKTAKRRLGRVGRFFLSFLLIFSMTAAVMVKEPVTVAHATGAEAVIVGVVAGTTGPYIAAAGGAVVVAAALAALGIGISAAVTGRTYQQTCEDTWNRISLQAKASIVVAGTAAQPIIRMGQEALLGIDAALKAAMADTANHTAITAKFGEGVNLTGLTLSSSELSAKLGVPVSIYSSSSNPSKYDTSFKDFRIWRAITELDTTGNTVITVPAYTSGAGVLINSKIMYDTAIRSGRFVEGYNNLGTYIGLPSYIVSYTSGDMARYTVLLHGSSTADSYTLLNTAIVGSGASAVLPDFTLGHDLINVANEDFYAREISSLNTKIDDLTARLEAAQGKQTGDGLDVYPPVAPTVPAGDADWWNKIRSKTQPQVLNIPADTVTPADKAKDDATNVGKDTTAVPDIPDTPSSGTPSGSTPSKITDITGGIPKVVSGVNGGFNGLNDLFKYLSDFFKFLAKAFSMFPAQISVVIIAVVVIAVVVRIFGRGGD